MENTALVNKYIEKLNDAVVEEIKKRIVSDSQVAAIEEANKALLENLDALKKEAEELLDEAQKQITELEEQVAELAPLRAQNEELQKDLSSSKEGFDRLQKTHNQVTNSYACQVKDLVAKNEYLEAQLAKYLPKPTTKKKKVLPST